MGRIRFCARVRQQFRVELRPDAVENWNDSRRFGKTNAPRKSLEQADTSPSSRYIPAPVKRAVRERDGNQCAFESASGKRCIERDGLEFHHREPFGRGGDHSPENIFLMCPVHNAYLAERDYGKEVMERHRRAPPARVSEPAPAYHVGDRAARAHRMACPKRDVNKAKRYLEPYDLFPP